MEDIKHIKALSGDIMTTEVEIVDNVMQPSFIELPDGKYSVKLSHIDLRTQRQSRALHLFFSMIAKELNNQGLTIPKVLKADVTFSPDAVKDYMWRPIQKAVTGKESTTKLEKKEIDQVYEVLNKLLGEKFGFHVPFPSIEVKDK